MALTGPSIRQSPRVSRPRRNPNALAREWEALLADGTIGSRADLAREFGVSRARVTQVLNLLNLPAQALEIVVEMGDPMPSRGISGHSLRRFLQLGPEEQET